MNDVSRFGAIAQLVEHLHGMQGVRGSNPLGSIELKIIVIDFFLKGLNKFKLKFNTFAILEQTFLKS